MEEKLDKLGENLDKLIEIVIGIDDKVTKMWRFNNMDINEKFPPFVHSHSPISLNSAGEKILDTYLGRTWVDSHKGDMINEISNMGFKSPLDVQEYTQRIMLSKLNSDDCIEIKNHIYSNPMHENQAVNIKTMALIMGLYLRDEYFSQNPDLIEGIA